MHVLKWNLFCDFRANLKPRLIELISHVANYTDGYRDDLFVQNKDIIKPREIFKTLNGGSDSG